MKKAGGKRIMFNTLNISPPVSFYSLSVDLINGENLRFDKLKGKKVLLVNTASDCVYTPQYAELQTLYEHSKEDLEIIAFPNSAHELRTAPAGTAGLHTIWLTKFAGPHL